MKNVGRSSGLEIALRLTLQGRLTPAFWMELSLIRAGTTLCILHSLLDVSGRPEPEWAPTRTRGDAVEACREPGVGRGALALERGDAVRPRSRRRRTIP